MGKKGVGVSFQYFFVQFFFLAKKNSTLRNDFFSIFLWETSHQPIKLFPNGCKFLCLHFDFERRAGNMIFSPFDDNNVISSIADGIVDLVAVVAQVFDKDFFARAFGSVDGNEEQIGTYVKSRFISIPSK